MIFIAGIAPGAVGGAALGLALSDRRKVAALAVMGAVWSSLVLIIGSYFMPLISLDLGVWFNALLMGAVSGAVAGTALGLAVWDWRDWKRMMGLALAGALGFAIGAVVSNTLPHNPWLRSVLGGIIAGAFLGAALSRLELRMEGVEPPKAVINAQRGWLPLAGLVFGVIGAGFSTYVATVAISAIGDFSKAWPLVVPFPIAWAGLILAWKKPSIGFYVLIPSGVFIVFTPEVFPALKAGGVADLAWIFIWLTAAVPILISGLLFLTYSSLEDVKKRRRP